MAQTKKNEIKEVVETTEVEEVKGFKGFIKKVLTKENLIKAGFVVVTLGVGAIVIKAIRGKDEDIIEIDDVE